MSEVIKTIETGNGGVYKVMDTIYGLQLVTPMGEWVGIESVEVAEACVEAEKRRQGCGMLRYGTDEAYEDLMAQEMGYGSYDEMCYWEG